MHSSWPCYPTREKAWKKHLKEIPEKKSIVMKIKWHNPCRGLKNHPFCERNNLLKYTLRMNLWCFTTNLTLLPSEHCSPGDPSWEWIRMRIRMTEKWINRKYRSIVFLLFLVRVPVGCSMYLEDTGIGLILINFPEVSEYGVGPIFNGWFIRSSLRVNLSLTEVCKRKILQ